ncbi:putative polyamine transporter [Hibiscus syriacus]|uniref:Polyamine transporter n=1 Tax=Hibiscus syriacus TaxID=106335 RepID=A0A6A3AM54_HIBSY|nr:probable polyamine transporter At3g13620 [Hibiscus syriacus]KAE8705694.1 putative polyamine transporter [Hibiscus syriacus]
MGVSCDESHQLLDHQETLPTTTATTKTSKKLSILPFIFLIYFEVSGGAYGAEEAVGAAGPFCAILGFLVFPFLWSIPEALITAELATAFPGNGGYVIWAHQAFGPFWGSLMGSWKFVSGVINLASCSVLCIDYLKLVFPVFSSGAPRYIAIPFLSSMLSLLNYTGLVVLGYAAIVLGVITLVPFILLALISIPRIDPSRWLSLSQNPSSWLSQDRVQTNWSLFFNTLFWNLNFWDNVSALAGEIDQPQKTFPKALFSAGMLTVLSNLVPLLTATGAIPLEQEKWVNGYFADAAKIIAGEWLMIFVEIGAVLSTIGFYEAQLTSSAYQLLGMAEIGFLPQCFSVRSKWFDTPWVGIVVSTSITIAVSYMNFANLISSVNFLYSLGMLLEFASFLWLRRKMPTMKRPFKVPMELPGLIIMCLIPCGFLVYIMSVANVTVLLVSTTVTLLTVLWYFVKKNIGKSKMWTEFNKGAKLVDVDLQ